jgi:hypothetical protein
MVDAWMASNNFIDHQHSLRAGLLIGALRAAGMTATPTTDRDGDWTPVVRIIDVDAGLQFDVELLAEAE